MTNRKKSEQGTIIMAGCKYSPVAFLGGLQVETAPDIVPYERVLACRRRYLSGGDGHILGGDSELKMRRVQAWRDTMKMMAVTGCGVALMLMMATRSAGQTVPVTPGSEESLAATRNSCSEKDVFQYTARRATGPVKVDGLPDEPDWQKAEKSPRFVDMATGEPAMYGTRAAAMWDDQNLYIAFWVEEPLVQAKMAQKNSLIFNESDAEVFIDGGDTYYEFETNARGTTYQMFYIWRDAYKKGGRFDVPEWDPVKNNALVFGGDYDRQAPTFWKGTNPRGLRWTYFGWEFPGMQSAVHVDGTLNDNSDIDKGWTVELVFPWKGAKWLAGDRALPPKDGDVWKIFFGRFELLHIAGQEVQPHPGWAMNKHGVYDTHLPQCWTAVHFSTKVVGEAGK